MAKARAAMRVFMVGLHIWTVVLALHRRLRPISRRLRPEPWQRRRPRHVTAITDSGRFRTIQIRHGAGEIFRAANSVCSLSPFGERVGVRGLPPPLTDPNPPRPFLHVAKTSSPLPGGERARAATARPRNVTL